MRRGGLEPPASPLSGECSAPELTARRYEAIHIVLQPPFHSSPSRIRTGNLRDVSAALWPLSYRRGLTKWACVDLNHGPPVRQTGALAMLSYRPISDFSRLFKGNLKVSGRDAPGRGGGEL